jgi:hypothetical protein
MKVSWKTLNENHVPLFYRDYCAHDWSPLNKYAFPSPSLYFFILSSLPLLLSCRLREGPFPWTCEHEKHQYEVCQFEQYQYRAALKEYLVKVGQWNKGKFPESDAVKY